MAFEKFLGTVPPQSFLANGTVLGKITLAESWQFKARQIVVVESTTQPSIELQVKRVEDGAVYVGPINEWSPPTRTDVSAYLVADSAKIRAGEQVRPFVSDNQNYGVDDLEHEEEPTNAKRVILVGKDGHPVDTETTLDGKNRLDVKTQEPLPVTIVGGGGGGSGMVLPTTPAITNVSVILANTEQSFSLPADTKRFLIRVREGTSDMRLAFISGNTASTYFTIRKGSVFTESDIVSSTTTLYFTTSLASQNVEIVVWSGGGAATNPTTPFIANAAIVAANIEQSLALPTSVRRFLIRTRGTVGDLRIAFTSGGTTTSWITVRAGTFFTESDISVSSLTLYFQSPTVGDIVEVISWV